jgi:hypothetical protein
MVAYAALAIVVGAPSCERSCGRKELLVQPTCVYVITCKVHTLMGMVCVVVVGDPVNINKIDPSGLPPKGRRYSPRSRKKNDFLHRPCD